MFNHIHYDIASVANKMKCMNLDLYLKKVFRHYSVRGLNIVLVILDTQPNSLKDQNEVGAPINSASKGKNAPMIEQCHHTL